MSTTLDLGELDDAAYEAECDRRVAAWKNGDES